MGRAPGVWVAALLALAGLAQEPSVRTTFRVRQVSGGTVYVDGGSADGLAEGMRLRVTHLAPGDALINRREIGAVTVFAVASHSAACEWKGAPGEAQAGDIAELFESDAEVIRIARASKARRHYAQVISFTEGDPIEEELRDYAPRPPSPEVNRFRGRIAFEQNAIRDHSSGQRTYQEGLVLRADLTRIGGSYWNLTGYWRGRLNTRSGASPETLNDLLNRTYHIGLHYNNPQSANVAGFGRFLLPWATSLNTIDGGYFGRRVSKDATVGVFAGSTPDPTAWNYDPNRQMLGAFASFDRGSFETVKYTGTAGAAISRLRWHPERQFLFFENSVLVRNMLSIYHNLEADQLARALVTDGRPRPRLSRSFFTVRVQPSPRLSIDLNHNYFRGVPTFDTRLIGTGLLDKLLFQGFSGGFRIELPFSTAVYTNLGASRREQDTSTSLNYMLGIAFARLPRMPFRTDLRYSHFNSSFGRGQYESISFSRQLGDRLRFELQGGQQNLSSAFSGQSRSRYVNSTLDYFLGAHYILGGGWTLYRGRVQNYDQVFLNLGYRF